MPLSFKRDYESLKFVIGRLNGELHVKLNDWEKSFIEDMQHKIDNDESFTTNQLNKISDIWEKY